MGKKALLTGASGGFGLALADALSAKGYTLTLVDFDKDGLSRMAKRYENSTFHVLDQLDNEAVAEFCESVVEKGETRFDVAIMNAGIVRVNELADMPRKDMMDELQVNLVSTAQLIQAFAVRMRNDGEGHIMATVSMGGLVSLKGSASYSASKFGLRGLLWGLRDELRAAGVSVTGIYPAGMDTPMLRHEARHGGSALNFVSTPGTAEDVANAYMRAIDKPRLEVYVPYSESFLARFANAWPWTSHYMYPLFERIGERGRRKFLQRIGDI